MVKIAYDVRGVSVFDAPEDDCAARPLPTEPQLGEARRGLLSSPALIQLVKRRWPLTVRTMRAFELGVWEERSGYWVGFPVRDQAGALVNIRRRYLGSSPSLNATGRKYQNWPGHGSPPRLFPAHRLPPSGSPLLVCCGEADAMTYWQATGRIAVTSTGGANTWPAGWDDLAERFDVTVTFDRGEEAFAAGLARRLGARARSLPFDLPRGADLADLYRLRGAVALRRVSGD